MREPRPAIPTAITRTGVIAIGRRQDPATVPGICDALLAGGIRAFELTLNEPESVAIEALAAAVRHCEGAEMVVGAGTVLTLEAARGAVDAGASFLVAPHLDPDVVTWAAGQGIPMLPGAASPTEVLGAWRAGAAAVKVFPASSLGAAFIRELRGPLPEIPLVPTGGVSVRNAADYIEAGAVAIGMGTWLFGDGSATTIADRSRQAVESVAAARAARAGRGS
jgi:2-dehydro-3-deoxyphosphogluconate aldolase / (4S)-4-hydroxy-2-oxoglutarate aldolase